MRFNSNFLGNQEWTDFLRFAISWFHPKREEWNKKNHVKSSPIYWGLRAPSWEGLTRSRLSYHRMSTEARVGNSSGLVVLPLLSFPKGNPVPVPSINSSNSSPLKNLSLLDTARLDEFFDHTGWLLISYCLRVKTCGLCKKRERSLRCSNTSWISNRYWVRDESKLAEGAETVKMGWLS